MAFLDWLLSLSMIFSRCIHVVHHLSLLQSFLLWNNIPLHQYATFYVPIPQLMDILLCPFFSCYKQSCWEHSCTNFCVDTCFHLLSTCKSSLCILATRPLSDVWFTNISINIEKLREQVCWLFIQCQDGSQHGGHTLRGERSDARSKAPQRRRGSEVQLEER